MTVLQTFLFSLLIWTKNKPFSRIFFFFTKLFHFSENDLLLLPGMPPPAFNETKAPQFMRRTSGGSNRVPLVPTGDFLPPCKIRDLQVSTSSYNESLVMLSFTAPGGNLDFGKGKTMKQILLQ